MPRSKRIKSSVFTKRGDEGMYNPKAFVPGAKCPNHGCRLHPTDTPGLGACEISECFFRYEINELTKDFQQKDETVIQNKIINGTIRPVKFKVQPLKGSLNYKNK